MGAGTRRYMTCPINCRVWHVRMMTASSPAPDVTGNWKARSNTSTDTGMRSKHGARNVEDLPLESTTTTKSWTLPKVKKSVMGAYSCSPQIRAISTVNQRTGMGSPPNVRSVGVMLSMGSIDRTNLWTSPKGCGSVPHVNRSSHSITDTSTNEHLGTQDSKRTVNRVQPAEGMNSGGAVPLESLVSNGDSSKQIGWRVGLSPAPTVASQPHTRNKTMYNQLAPTEIRRSQISSQHVRPATGRRGTRLLPNGIPTQTTSSLNGGISSKHTSEERHPFRRSR